MRDAYQTACGRGRVGSAHLSLAVGLLGAPGSARACMYTTAEYSEVSQSFVGIGQPLLHGYKNLGVAGIVFYSEGCGNSACAARLHEGVGGLLSAIVMRNLMRCGVDFWSPGDRCTQIQQWLH